MKPGQGKNKGSSFERVVGNKLSLWITNGERNDLFCRTVLSGGQYTITSGGNPGDLMAQHPSGFRFMEKFVVEAKFWKDLKFLQFLSGKGDLFKAMEKVTKEAKNTNRRWWLVARQNHQKDILLMERQIITSALPSDSCPMYHQLFCGTVVMWYLDEFLKNVDPEEYLQL